jgi:hypothetical protein
MKLTRDGRFERTDIWREGKYLDLWSVVHFLSGASLGLGFYFLRFLDLGVTGSIVIVFLLLVAYELWEAMVKIAETPQNRILDVVVGMTSFLPVFLLLAPLLSQALLIFTFGIVLTANVVFATFGWLESRKAEELEAKLRADLAKQRARFVERSIRRRARHDAALTGNQKTSYYMLRKENSYV